MEFPFRCGVSNGSQGGWCLGGGRCLVENDGTERCVECAEGWIHDYSWARSDNCGLHVAVLQFFCAFSTFYFFTSLAWLLWRRRSITRRSRRIIRLFMFVSVCEFVENTMLLIERGRYTATNFLLGIRTFATSLFFLEFTLMVLKSSGPVFRREDLRRARRLWFTAVCIPAVTCSLFCFHQAFDFGASNVEYNS